MALRPIFISVLLCLLQHFDQCNGISHMITERPVVTYLNESFAKYFIINSRRVSRQDPRYYVNIYVQTLVYVSNKVRMDFYFYQLLTNRYRPSFVELHFGFCDMTEKDPIIGSQLKGHLQNLTCPYPPRQYNLTNMAIPFVPKNFPFQRGRIYLNVTRIDNEKVYVYLNGYIDMEIKNFAEKKNKN